MAEDTEWLRQGWVQGFGKEFERRLASDPVRAFLDEKLLFSFGEGRAVMISMQQLLSKELPRILTAEGKERLAESCKVMVLIIQNKDAMEAENVILEHINWRNNSASFLYSLHEFGKKETEEAERNMSLYQNSNTEEFKKAQNRLSDMERIANLPAFISEKLEKHFGKDGKGKKGGKAR